MYVNDVVQSRVQMICENTTLPKPFIYVRINTAEELRDGDRKSRSKRANTRSSSSLSSKGTVVVNWECGAVIK